jgi:hypothetical protein
MARLGTGTLCGAVAGLAMLAGADRGFAMEPGNFGQTLQGTTIGAIIAAPAPPGVYIVNETFVGPHGPGVGQKAGTDVTVPLWGPTLFWSTGWQFLGANVAGAVVQPFYYVAAYPANGATLGGNGSGPPFGNTVWFENTANTLFTPIILQWTLGHGWFADLGVTFIAPDGSHYNGTNNPDYWTVEPRGGVAYIDRNWHFTANFKYDINGTSAGHTGTYQIAANLPFPLGFGGTPLASTIAGIGNGYRSGNVLFGDFALTYQFGKLEVGPVASFHAQTTTDTPGGGFTCAQLAATLPASLGCGKSSNVSVGGLAGYNFGVVDWQVWVTDTVSATDDFRGWGIYTRLTYKLWGPDAPPKPMITK